MPQCLCTLGVHPVFEGATGATRVCYIVSAACATYHALSLGYFAHGNQRPFPLTAVAIMHLTLFTFLIRLYFFINSCLRVKSKQLLPEFSREFGRLQAARVQLLLSLGCVPSAQMADEVAPSWHPWHPQKKVQTPCTSAFGHRGILFCEKSRTLRKREKSYGHY